MDLRGRLSVGSLWLLYFFYPCSIVHVLLKKFAFSDTSFKGEKSEITKWWIVFQKFVNFSIKTFVPFIVEFCKIKSMFSLKICNL